MKSNRKALIATAVTIGITLVAIFLSFAVPVPKGNDPNEFYFDLAVSLATMLLYVGGSVVNILGFGAFTSKLRRAYAVIFTGLTLWALAYLQLPLLVITDQINNDIAVSLTVLPFIASAICVFTGTRMLAKLFDVKSKTTKWWFALALVAVVAATIIIAPHVPGKSEEIQFDIANALVMTAVTFFGLGACNILLVKKQASVVYTKALAWLCISMAVLAVFAGAGSTLTTLVASGPGAAQLVVVMAIIPSCLAAALFLRSAYCFNQIVESKDAQGQTIARNFFGRPLHAQVHDDTTSLDIVMYTAGLVSNPSAIDPQLEVVRGLTAGLKSDQKLGEQDEQALMDTYTQVENYLLTKEPLRVFTKESLRQDIAQKLRLTADSAGTFWPKMS